MSLLELRALQVRYGAVVGVAEVSFTLAEGKTLALVGSNGAGKSSTLRAILGLAPRTGGEILFEGQPSTGWKTARLVRSGIALSPEGRRVFAHLTVAENLRAGGFTQPGARLEQRQEEMFGYFPRLRERARQFAGSLSGGEQQMLAIARALMARPKVLMLDEPSLGVAPVIVQRIGEMLKEIQTREPLALLIAEQNARWSMSLADEVVVMRLGRSVLAGPAETVRQDDTVQQMILG